MRPARSRFEVLPRIGVVVRHSSDVVDDPMTSFAFCARTEDRRPERGQFRIPKTAGGRVKSVRIRKGMVTMSRVLRRLESTIKCSIYVRAVKEDKVVREFRGLHLASERKLRC